MNQRGLAPILIVILIAAGIGGYLIYQKQYTTSKIITTPQLLAQPTNAVSPTTTSTPTVVSAKPTSSIKPILTATPKPSSTPSPTGPVSPTSKPSSIAGVYKIERQPKSGEYTTSLSSQGYVMSALLTDSNGDYIQDLSDFEFKWSVDNPEIVDLLVDSFNNDPSYCYSFSPYNIKTPCPGIRADLKGKMNGSTTVRVKVTKKSDNKVVAEESYPFTVR